MTFPWTQNPIQIFKDCEFYQNDSYTIQTELDNDIITDFENFIKNQDKIEFKFKNNKNVYKFDNLQEEINFENYNCLIEFMRLLENH